MEVAEHIPRQHEEALLANWDAHNTKGIVMSWSSSRSAGTGHVNPRTAAWVEETMTKRGYREDRAAGVRLRAAVGSWVWLRGSNLNKGWKKGAGVSVWRRRLAGVAGVEAPAARCVGRRCAKLPP